MSLPQDDIMQHIAMVRATGDGGLMNLQGHLLHLVPHCAKYMALGCRTQSWPQLFSFLERARPAGSPPLLDELRAMHLTLFRFIDAAASEDPEVEKEVAKHSSFYQTLDMVGWGDVPIAGRVGYLSMLGLYIASRMWVLNRQYVNAPYLAQDRPYDVVCKAAADVLQAYDQRTTTKAQAIPLVIEAAIYCRSTGVSLDDVKKAAEIAYLSNMREVPDVSVLSPLFKL